MAGSSFWGCLFFNSNYACILIHTTLNCVKCYKEESTVIERKIVGGKYLRLGN